MTNNHLAIALCRVSSAEQLENNSLNRQRAAVVKAAEELGVVIPEDGWWSGSVSSKRGTNVGRKDLQAAVAYCKKHPRVKYVIVDEPDRFMRSIDEAAFFEVTFRNMNVTVWYASDPELNKGNLASKLLKFTKYLSAEGSNEERQNKSISGLTKAIAEGRYPFQPKAGYKRGYKRGIHEIDDIRGPILKGILEKIAAHRISPSEGLVELNNSEFGKGRAAYKMDKFRKILVDPFYAGIVEMNKQVRARNENGLHTPLITFEQHKQLEAIMSRRPKNQSGPLKGGNPLFPISNIVNCSKCKDKKYGRLVGLELTNGKPNSRIYEKYRCRGCHDYIQKDVLHEKVQTHLKRFSLSEEAQNTITEELRRVWKRESQEAELEIQRIRARIKGLNEVINSQTEAAIDPSNNIIRDEIIMLIAGKKSEVKDLTEKLEQATDARSVDEGNFLSFALEYLSRLSEEFFNLTKEERLQCKQLVFPAGFYIDSNKNVYTPEISSIFRLATSKKDAVASYKALMVRVRRL